MFILKDVTNVRPITYAEASAAIRRIEELAEELANQLRWASEHGFCVGDGVQSADEFVDNMPTFMGSVIGLGDCTCGRCTVGARAADGASS